MNNQLKVKTEVNAGYACSYVQGRINYWQSLIDRYGADPGAVETLNNWKKELSTCTG